MSEIGKTERSDAYKTRLEMQQREQLQQLKEKMRGEIEGVVNHHERIKEDLNTAYNVEISKERELFDAKLTDTRESNARRLEEEKMGGDLAVEKVKRANQEQVTQLREDSEKSIAAMRRKYEMALQDMKRRTEKGSS